MKKETRTFITWMFPGSFFPEEIVEQVNSADIPKTIPADCFGFRFHEKEFVVDGENEYYGKPKPLGKTYLVGEAIPLAQIPDEDGGRTTEILKRNIEYNSPTKTAIRTRTGNWQMEDENHVAIDADRFKISEPRLYKNWKQ